MLSSISQLRVLALCLVALLSPPLLSAEQRRARANDPPSDTASVWTSQKSANNPVITILRGVAHWPDPERPFGNTETKSQYVPAPIRLKNGDVWIYVKGDESRAIMAYKSVDGGETFQVQNGAKPVLAPGPAGTWDDAATLDPAAFFDARTDTIHFYYKGGSGRDTGPADWAWGYATARGTAPTVFTRHPENPILTGAAVATAFGLSGVHDNYVSDVIKIGGEFFFYGGYQEGPASDYKIFYATGNSPHAPVPQATILAPRGPYDIVQAPTVFRIDEQSLYTMIFSEGCERSCQPESRLMIAYSTDGRNWERAGGELLAPSRGWESTKTFAASVLKGAAPPYDTPERINDKILVYYSGYDGSPAGTTQTGLLRLVRTEMPMILPSLLTSQEQVVVDDGVFLVRSRVSAGASKGELVLGNARSVRSVDAEGLSTYSLVRGTTSNTVQIGGGRIVTVGAAGYLSDAAPDDLILKSGRSVRSVNAGGTASIPLITLDNDNSLRLGGAGGIRARLGSPDGRLHLPVVPTALLPLPGMLEDGSILIEDAGAGNRNLVIYAGGQRFRIDGGQPF